MEDKQMKKSIRIFSFLIFLSVMLAIPSGVLAADKPGGQIVFVNCRIFVKNLIATDCGLSIVNSDGNGSRQITDGVDDKMPALSPDGKKVAFSSMRRDGNYAIYVINTDGTGFTRLTDRSVAGVSPEWSPDGKKIAFAGSAEGGTPNKQFIFVINADGSDLKQITKLNGFAPSWSADGEKIYYVLPRNNVNDIMSVKAEGGGDMGVKSVPARQVNPAVISPDGKQIAFLSQKTDADPIELNLTTKAQNWNDMVLLSAGYMPIFGGLSWSPDGKKLIFSMHGDGKSLNGGSRLFLINTDGSGLEKFPVECLYCYGADWGVSAK
jgi:Tol biopolymer transport system component